MRSFPTSPEQAERRHSSAEAPATVEVPARPPVSARRRWAVLVFLLVGQFTIISSLGTINVALPPIAEDLNATPAQMQWVVVAYQLSYAIVLVTGGRLGDIIGRKRAFIIGVGGFVAASVLAGAAPNVAVIIAARVAQGVFGGLATPQILAVIQVIFGLAERGRAIALFAMITGGSFMLGQLAAGALISLDVFGLGWRAAFLVNLIPGSIALVATAVLLPRRKSSSGARLDVAGVVLVSVSVLLVLYPVIEGRSAGWPPYLFAIMAAGIPVLAVLIGHERRLADAGGHPVVNLRLFGSSSFRLGLLFAVLTSLCSFPGYLYLTITLQQGLGLDAWTTALTTTPVTFGLLASAGLSDRLIARAGRTLFVLCAVCTAGAMVLITVVLVVAPDPVNPLVLLPAMVLLGLGHGAGNPSVVNLVLIDVHHGDAGTASGLLQTVQQLASSFGVAILGTLYFEVTSGVGGDQAHVAGLGAVSALVAAVCVVVFVAHFRLPRHIRHDPLAIGAVPPG